MSSSTNLDSLRFATQQINLYGELFVFITGMLGELLNIVVFTTLKTFRQTTCSLYLITASVANIGILIAILLRIIYDGLNIGLTYTPLLCKFRFFLTQYWGLVSITSMCFATFDQFISMTIYKHWSNTKIARRLIAFTNVLWFINSIPSFIYYESYLNVCIVTNAAFIKYYTYFQTPLLFGFLPLTIMIIFSFLAFLKTRTITSRQINIVRLSRDRQLTAMTLVHVLFVVILTIPFLIYFIYDLTINNTDPIQIAHHQLIYSTIVIFYYISYSVRFLFDQNKSFRSSLSFSVFILYLLLCIKAFS
jgi:hypothetical protein